MHDGGVAGDDALGLETVDASLDRGDGQVHLLGDVREAAPRVLLQQRDDLFSYWADQSGGAEELNSSEFSCEDVTAALDVATGETDPSITVEEPILEKVAMEGRTLFNASGDTGSGC